MHNSLDLRPNCAQYGGLRRNCAQFLDCIQNGAQYSDQSVHNMEYVLPTGAKHCRLRKTLLNSTKFLTRLWFFPQIVHNTVMHDEADSLPKGAKYCRFRTKLSNDIIDFGQILNIIWILDKSVQNIVDSCRKVHIFLDFRKNDIVHFSQNHAQYAQCGFRTRLRDSIVVFKTK
jgi:hypothetical protein